MYFPYVYGQSSELLALRSASANYFSSGVIVPVIEPVKEDPSRLVRCLEMIGLGEQRAVVILNPSQGEFSKGVPASWHDAMIEVLDACPSIVPALLCRPGIEFKETLSFLDYFSTRKAALLYRNATFSDEQMAKLAQSKNVAFHIVVQSKISASQLKFLPSSKVVHVTDRFNKRLRNADYVGSERFTDSHKNFATNAVGFGDYTVTGSELQTGGGPPGAVAIHITYRNPADGDIWIQHFVSDEIDRDEGSAGSKFLEAVTKLKDEHSLRSLEFGANPALTAYFNDHAASHFPGLAKNKERQILHHIARVHELLTTGG